MQVLCVTNHSERRTCEQPSFIVAVCLLFPDKEVKMLLFFPEKGVIDDGVGLVLHRMRTLLKPQEGGCAWVEFVVMDNEVSRFII